MLVAPDTGRRLIFDSERTINDALMQHACRPNHSFGEISRDTLIGMLEEIADLRFGEPVRSRACGFYSGPLFWDVFGYGGSVVVDNVSYRMARQKQRLNNIWNDCEPQKMADALYTFHTAFARGCEDETMDRLAISGLCDQFLAQTK